MKKTNFKEEIIMIKNKQKIIELADRIDKELTSLVYEIQQLDSHEEQTVLNVINEIGLPDLEELEYQFGRLAEMADKVEVIGGYQVWVDSYHELNVIVNNQHIRTEGTMERVFDRLLMKIEDRQTAKNIFKWYFDKTY
jgi:hypothetical protein